MFYTLKAAFYFYFFFFTFRFYCVLITPKSRISFFRKKFRFNRASNSRSGAMVRHRNFQNVITFLNRGFKPLKQHFIHILFFNFRFNRALISRSGAVVRHRNFQSVIASLNRGCKPLKQHFI